MIKILTVILVSLILNSCFLDDTPSSGDITIEGKIIGKWLIVEQLPNIVRDTTGDFPSGNYGISIYDMGEYYKELEFQGTGNYGATYYEWNIPGIEGEIPTIHETNIFPIGVNNFSYENNILKMTQYIFYPNFFGGHHYLQTYFEADTLFLVPNVGVFKRNFGNSIFGQWRIRKYEWFLSGADSVWVTFNISESGTINTERVKDSDPFIWKYEDKIRVSNDTIYNINTDHNFTYLFDINNNYGSRKQNFLTYLIEEDNLYFFNPPEFIKDNSYHYLKSP